MNKQLIDAAYARYDRFMIRAGQAKRYSDSIADAQPVAAFYAQRAAFRLMDAGDVAYRHYLKRKYNA